jgi:hypothetical protein
MQYERPGQRFYSTTITVLLGEPSPDLLIAITRYSSSAPFGWSTNVDSVSIAAAGRRKDVIPVINRRHRRENKPGIHDV